MIRQQSGISKQALDAGWTFRQVGKDEWAEATVPGCVHLDLMAHKLIDDPFHRDNVNKIQWIHETDWEYRLTFDVEPEVFARKYVHVVFDQLDTLARVTLNEKVILDADNMFHPWRADVKELLRKADNELRVLFRSPTREAQPLMERHPYKLPAPNDQAGGASPFLRKAPYHFGWDWGPCLVTCGITKAVHIEAWDAMRITDVVIHQRRIDRQSADLEVDLEVESTVSGEAILVITWNGAPSRQFPVILQTGTNRLVQMIQILEPQLWWPAGMGHQQLYYVTVELFHGHEVFPVSRSIGIRSLEVVRKPDPWGTSFEIVVNGVPVFAKGANWIPCDNFLTRVTGEKLRHMVYGAIASNMNMLRVWGGGVYEDDEFYLLCDQSGILVWQDFMFACSLYPGDDAFLRSVRKEAEYQVRRLRHHPSIALWCGNNEVEHGWCDWGWKREFPPEAWGNYQKLFDQLLPDVCRQLDPERLYWPSSPASDTVSTGRPQDPACGDVHAWDAWGQGAPMESFGDLKARFVSEFGFQSFPDLRTIAQFTSESDRSADSDVMLVHQRAPGGNAKIIEQMACLYRVPERFDHLVLLSQILQAEFIKFGVEHFRRLRPQCMGCLYWQLNDCWPVVSWSSVDYHGRWKALQYYAGRFYSPVLISIVRDGEEYHVHIVSDRTEPVQARLIGQLVDLTGRVIAAWRRDILVRPLHSDRYLMLGGHDLPAHLDPRNTLLRCSLFEGNMLLSENAHYFAAPKDMAFRDPQIKVTPYSDETGSRVVLSAGAVVRHVVLQADRLDGMFENNFFDLFPGEVRQVRLLSNQRVSDFDLSQAITITSLFDMK
ncbi:MAG: glycoside hydrolase family 2 protein [bacterium]